MRLTHAIASGIAVAALSGCASFVAPGYSPDYPSIDRMKTSQFGPVAVDTFQPQKPDAPVNRITLRGTPLTPQTGTFATYLENAIRADLTELRVLDPASTTRIGATLLKNDIDVSGFTTGEGTMDVQLTVRKNGATVLDKVYSARTKFESSFAGAVAIPRGQSEYPALVRALLAQVYADPAFVAAVRK
jgi:hypothetical protein